MKNYCKHSFNTWVDTCSRRVLLTFLSELTGLTNAYERQEPERKRQNMIRYISRWERGTSRGLLPVNRRRVADPHGCCREGVDLTRLARDRNERNCLRDGDFPRVFVGTILEH